VADNMTKTKHKPNKELIGQGIGNSISAMFGGIPGAGATIRTVVNINSGGKTRISGMIAGLVLLMILLLFSSAASTIPAAVLAGILVTVGIGVMDYKGLRAIPSLPRDIKIGKTGISSEVVVMLVVMLLSTVWNLVYAVGIGLVMASLMFMKKIGDLTENSSEVNTGSKEKLWEDEKSSTLLKSDNIAIKHINGPLFFGSTDGFQKLAKTIKAEANTVLFRFDRMEYIDQSGLYALEDLLVDLSKQGKRIYFIHLPKQPRYMMERIGLLPKLVPAANVFEELPDFLNHIKSQN
jgi:SulP family sulfate permease